MEIWEIACFGGRTQSVCVGFIGIWKGYNAPFRRVELVVNDRLMAMGVERRRRELQKRVEAGRRDAIFDTRRQPIKGKFPYAIVLFNVLRCSFERGK